MATGNPLRKALNYRCSSLDRGHIIRVIIGCVPHKGKKWRAKHVNPKQTCIRVIIAQSSEHQNLIKNVLSSKLNPIVL